MPTHKPDLSRLSISQLHQLTGRSRETIRRRLEGLEPAARDGKTIWYEAREALPRIAGGEGLDLSAERARLAREQADAQEMKNAVARGELVPADQIEGAWVALLSGVRTRLLAVCGKAAPTAHAAETIAATEEAIRIVLIEALEELADGPRQRTRRGNGEAHAPA